MPERLDFHMFLHLALLPCSISNYRSQTKSGAMAKPSSGNGPADDPHSVTSIGDTSLSATVDHHLKRCLVPDRQHTLIPRGGRFWIICQQLIRSTLCIVKPVERDICEIKTQ
jgi:hypothetical protein